MMWYYTVKVVEMRLSADQCRCSFLTECMLLVLYCFITVVLTQAYLVLLHQIVYSENYEAFHCSKHKSVKVRTHVHPILNVQTTTTIRDMIVSQTGIISICTYSVLCWQ